MTDTTVAPATTELLHLEPAQLILDHNIRKQVDLDKAFLASIKTHGIINPILVTDLGDGTYSVLEGQRRVLAAIDNKKTPIPAIAITADPTEIERIVRQLTLNEQRAPISDADKTAAYQQMSFFGATADLIAKKTHTPKARVETALKVAASTVGTAAIQEYALTLEDAAVFVEFEDSDEDVHKLADSLQSGRFAHTAESIRTDRAERTLIAESADKATADGWTITAWPKHDDPKAKRIDSLYSDSAARKQITAEQHKDCPGRALAITTQTHWTDGGNKPVTLAVTREVCTDWKANGHFTYGSSSGSSAGPLSEEEKAARKESRDNTKAWVPASTVRITWLTEFLARKELPADALSFVARYFTALPHWSTQQSLTASILLGLNQPDADGNRTTITQLLTDQSKALNALLAVALAAVEGEYEFGKKGWQSSSAPRYLAQLSQWGYTLSELEESVAKKASK